MCVSVCGQNAQHVNSTCGNDCHSNQQQWQSQQHGPLSSEDFICATDVQRLYNITTHAHTQSVAKSHAIEAAASARYTSAFGFIFKARRTATAAEFSSGI